MAIGSTGNCYMCGKTAGKTAIKNHILKDHDSGDESCYLVKAEGAYNKNYWLLFTVPLDASLSIVDKFLHEVWCECCGHLSAFRMGGREYGKSRKLSALSIGDTLLYEYDFGSTTEIVVTISDEISRAKQREKVQLLARNTPVEEKCDHCGALATMVDPLDGYAVLCGKCAENAEDDSILLPITNSPRSGECGYDGELDIWTFDQNKPFPQPQKPKSRRGGARIPPDKEEMPAEIIWGKISDENQKKLINNVFCVKCKLTTIVDYAIENSGLDIVLRGKCAKCGGKVARVIECE